MTAPILPTKRRLSAIRAISTLIAARNIAIRIVFLSEDHSDPAAIVVGDEADGSSPEVESASAFARAAMDHLDPGGDGHASITVALPFDHHGDAGTHRTRLSTVLATLYDGLPVGHGHGGGADTALAGSAISITHEELIALPDENVLRRFAPPGMSSLEALDFEIAIAEALTDA